MNGLDNGLAHGARSIGSYKFASHDSAARFSHPLLFVGWDEHMMFAAPFTIMQPMDMTFAEFVHKVLPKLFGEHPDFNNIGWDRAQWFRGDVMFTPRMDATLAQNGLGHKSVLRFRTPGLEGLRGSCG